MPKVSKQISFKLRSWGGRRAGAGRKNRSGKAGHVQRESVRSSTPLHISWRLEAGLVNLRCGLILKEFERCAKLAKSTGFSILHFSLQGNHLHLIVEARSNSHLGRGMRSLGCSFGKLLRKISRGRGRVFTDRYHLHVLKTPTETKRALAYVLQNTSRHTKFIYHLDAYSSAAYFSDWKALLGEQVGPILLNRSNLDLPLPDFLGPPRSWLARVGWKRARVTG